MIWTILIMAVIVLLVLKAMGVFRKEANCRHCNATLKGTEQKMIDSGQCVLCKECYGKIHPLLRDSTHDWGYETYLDYLAWEEETKEERELFTPTVVHGSSEIIKVDLERGLFSIEESTNKPLVLKFSDLLDVNFDITNPEIKESMFGTKVEGNEYFSVTLERPQATINGVLRYGVKCKAKLTNFFTKEYRYFYSDGFANLVESFAECIDVSVNMQNHQAEGSSRDDDGIQKALNLFMFDSIEEVTPESLKKQRNALIKAFHPDNDEENEAYSQKINAAYEILKDTINA